MTVVSKQTLLDYFSSGGRAKNPTSTGEWEFEDLIDTLFYYGDKIDGYHGLGSTTFVPVIHGNLSMGREDHGDPSYKWSEVVVIL